MEPETLLTKTMKRLYSLVRAGDPVIYVASYEEERVLTYLYQVFRRVRSQNPQKKFVRWDAVDGLTELRADTIVAWSENPSPESASASAPDLWLEANDRNPLSFDANDWQSSPRREPATADTVIAELAKEKPGLDLSNDAMVTFLDLHHDLGTRGVNALVRRVRDTASKALRHNHSSKNNKRHFRTLIVLGPSAANLPDELLRSIEVVEFPLPEQDELLKAYKGSALVRQSTDPGRPIDDSIAHAVASAGRGLTLQEFKRTLNWIAATNADASALGQADIDYILARKSQVIREQALRYSPRVNVELGGLNNVKKWIRSRKAAVVDRRTRKEFSLPPPRGMLLCGVPGGGKSQLAKLIAAELGLALLQLDVGALFGMYVGESEERTRRALQIAEMLSPVVLWIDEVDKAFGTMEGDSGVSRRVFGHLLTWLAEKRDDVFVVATANDPETLLTKFPEFGRKGRFDKVFWIGLPKEESRKEIFKIYLTALMEQGAIGGLGGDLIVEDLSTALASDRVSGRMTGAEIEQALIDARYEAYDRDAGAVTVDDIKAKILQASEKAQLRNNAAGPPQLLEFADEDN